MTRQGNPSGLSPDEIEALRTRIAMLDAVIRAAREPRALLDVVAEAADREAAVSGVEKLFTVDREAAQLIVDLQLSRLTLEGKAQLERDLEESRMYLADHS